MNQRRRFRILETLGRGGFGTVYRAELTDAGGFAKQVALKVMHYEGEQSDDIARRMRDEARVLGLLRHRAIVGVNSLVRLQSGWGVVMEYIRGVDLSTAIKAGKLPVGVCLEVVEEVAGALDQAYNVTNHETGEALHLIHRDIKPSNVRITRQGEVKLLDFGVAQADFSARESEDSVDFVMGSTRYMAPERRGGRESHQGDVYALGLVLGNMLTRKRFPEPPPLRDDHAKYLSVVSETVYKRLAQSEHPEVQAAAGELKLLLLEMLAFEAADRPDAGAIERRARRIRARMPPPLLKDWADRTIPKLSKRESERDADPSGDSDQGRTLLEQSGASRVLVHGERPPTEEGPTRAPTRGGAPTVPPLPWLLAAALAGSALTLLIQWAAAQS